jgi:hypothetical protein
MIAASINPASTSVFLIHVTSASQQRETFTVLWAAISQNSTVLRQKRQGTCLAPEEAHHQ